MLVLPLHLEPGGGGRQAQASWKRPNRNDSAMALPLLSGFALAARR